MIEISNKMNFGSLIVILCCVDIVGISARRQIRLGEANRDTVFENRLALANVLHSNFVSGRHNVTGHHVTVG